MPTKEQKALYQKRWYEKNKAKHQANTHKRRQEVKARVRAFVTEIKESSPCTDCGINYPYYVMDFDHMRDKKFDISYMIGQGYDIPAVEEEIKKCEVVCANCHRQRTHERASVAQG